MEQKPQYQGPERRQSQSQYPGDERRKPDTLFEDETLPPTAAKPGMGTQAQTDEREERTKRRREQHDDTQ